MLTKPPKGRSLAEVNPELAKEWHPTKNRGLIPYDISSVNSKKVWWKCGKGDDHVWTASVANSSKGRRCPVCRGLKVLTKNTLI